MRRLVAWVDFNLYIIGTVVVVGAVVAWLVAVGADLGEGILLLLGGVWVLVGVSLIGWIVLKLAWLVIGLLKGDYDDDFDPKWRERRPPWGFSEKNR